MTSLDESVAGRICVYSSERWSPLATPTRKTGGRATMSSCCSTAFWSIPALTILLGCMEPCKAGHFSTRMYTGSCAPLIAPRGSQQKRKPPIPYHVRLRCMDGCSIWVVQSMPVCTRRQCAPQMQVQLSARRWKPRPLLRRRLSLRNVTTSSSVKAVVVRH